MDVKRTKLPGVLLLRPLYFRDTRGHFVETYSKRMMERSDLRVDFVQDNQSLSLKAGTVRGLHFQIPPKPQAKLIRVLCGSIYDVAVDLRVGSPSYGHWTGETLTAADGEQLFI